MLKPTNFASKPPLIFPVSDVLPAEQLLPEVPYLQAVDILLKGTPPARKFAPNEVVWEVEIDDEELGVLVLEPEEPPPAPPMRKTIKHRILSYLIGFEKSLEEKKAKPSNRTIEACSDSGGQLVDGVYFHPFMAAVHLAFNDHRPLSLSPDMIWLLISQGFAQHLNLHSESLRKKLVAHQGQCTIKVRRDNFVKGSPENPWAEVFGEFSAAIRQHLGETTHDLLVPTFSTTGSVEKAASEIVLLDAVQSYFRFELETLCGIPQIQLEGTVADWQDLLQRTKQLAQFELEWWIDALIPLLERFVVTMQGHPINKAFWQSIYRYEEISGSDIITGWIAAFFPYLNDKKTGKITRNPTLAENIGTWDQFFEPDCFASNNPWKELSTDKLSSGLAKVPFTWKYLWHRYPMELMGGFVGVSQDHQTQCLRPEIGWIVCDVSDHTL